MSTEFFNDQWRIPTNSNQNKVSNYSCEFDGTSDKIEFGDVNGFEQTDSFSFSLWVNISSYTTYYYISKQLATTPFTGFILFSTSNGQLQFLLNNTFSSNTLRVNSSSQIPLNQWVNLTLTYDGSSLANGVNMYFNGVSQTIITVNNNLTATTLNTTEFQISGRDGGNGNLVGKIDQVSVFDYALSQAQVSQLGAVEGYAFNFDGVDDKITISGATDLTINGDLTMSMWFKARSFDDFEYIFRLGSGTVQNGDRMIGFKTSKISTNTYADSSGAFNVLGNTTLSTGVWYHVAIVYSSNTVIIYLNGDADSASITTTMGTISYVTTTIGESYNGLDFAGEVSNAQIFNSVIPPTGSNSIKTIYNNGKPLTNMSGFTSLQGWWKLDNTATLSGSTWSIPDASTNSNTGTSSGMTASSLVGTNINGELVGNPMGLSPKPVSYYQLGDQSVSTGANYLVPNNSLSDYVFSFDRDDNDFIDVDNSNDDLNIPFGSFAFWFYPTTTTSETANLLSCNRTSVEPAKSTWRMAIQNQGTVAGKARINFVADNHGNNNYSGFDVVLNQWNHYIAVKPDATNGNTRPNFYINGQPSAGGATNLGGNFNYSNITTDKVYIGRLAHPSFIGGFNGEVSNVQIFNAALSSVEAQTLYNNGSPLTSMSGFTSLQSWWKLNAADTFNGNNWTIKDYAGSNDGTSSGMTSANLIVSDLQHTSGFSPYALDFGGITASLKTATIPAATNTVTLSAWVKRTGATGSYGGVFGIRNTGGAPGYGLCWQLCFFSTTNKIQMRISEAVGVTYKTVTQDTAMIDNTWTHVVGVADGTNVYLYINGVLQSDTTTYNGNLLNATSNIHFAAQGHSGTNAFNGQLSNCARWNIGLTQAQITEIYNQGVPSNLNTFSGTAPIGW